MKISKVQVSDNTDPQMQANMKVFIEEQAVNKLKQKKINLNLAQCVLNI